MLRGYLANAEKVRVRGVEFDTQARVTSNFTLYGAAAYTDGRYVSFTDAPPPLEDTGGPQVKDISGSVLPGISKWALTAGGEYGRPGPGAGPVGAGLRRPGRQLSHRLLLEPERVAVPGRAGLLAGQPARRGAGGRTAGR